VLGQSSLFADSTARLPDLGSEIAPNPTPIAGCAVEWPWKGTGTGRNSASLCHGDDGSLSDAVHVPALAPGRYRLIIESSSDWAWIGS